MPSTFLKPTQIVSAGLGILERDLTLGRLVWTNPISNFAGALNDTVSIRLPAYTDARSRALRSGASRTRDKLAEHKVDVSLDTDIYKDIRITDEELTLDIANFGAQVLNPVMAAVARKVEDAIVAEMQGATYAVTLPTYDYSDNSPGAANYDPAAPLKKIALPARKALNDARVPFDGRYLVVGSGIEQAILGSDNLLRVDASGSDSALRDATIGRLAGFEVVTSPALNPDEAYAFHRSAFVMCAAAPVVPTGAPYGANGSFGGYAMRTVRVMDSATIEDILAVDAWIGSSIVADEGTLDAQGRFIPSSAVTGAGVTIASSDNTTEVITTSTPHGFVPGDQVQFTALTGGAGLVVNRAYFVLTAPTTTTFTVSDTLGGPVNNHTTNITAGSVRTGTGSVFVRAVKIVGQA